MTWDKEKEYKNLLAQKLNSKFDYDVNTDELYQQYVDSYSKMGKRAAEDVMGQASALTGGYGNSYATTAAAQTYQQYLDKASSAVPDFYQSAVDKYILEQDQIDSKLAALSNDYEMYVQGLKDDNGVVEGSDNGEDNVENKGYFDYNDEDYKKNSREYGGSHYSTVLADLKSMKATGVSAAEVKAYLDELVGNSLITKSDYMSLYNKYRDNNL